MDRVKNRDLESAKRTMMSNMGTKALALLYCGVSSSCVINGVTHWINYHYDLHDVNHEESPIKT